MKHRVISLVLILVLAFGLAAPPVRAVEAAGDWQFENTGGGLRLTGYLGTETELTLPDELAGERVVSVGAGCFQGSSVTEVTIPHGIRIIEAEAFAECTALKKVHLGGSVNVIGERAFANSGLIKMDIPGCVRSIGAEAFLNCESLYNVVIEEGVEDWSLDIGVGVGSGSVKLEEGLESIGARAFYGCANLTRMFVPASVTAIGAQAMGFTDAGRQGYQISGYAGSVAEDYAVSNSLTFKALESERGMKGKCGPDVNWSFDRNTGTLTIAGSGRMYDYAAAECLPWYGFRQDIAAAVVGEGITSVGEYAFADSAAAQVTLPLSLKWVGTQAFARCGELKELTFPGDAPEFAGDAFADTTLTAWYPADNGTWKEETLLDYGGDITWCRPVRMPFVDVPKGSFYYDAVAWALEEGVTTGTDETHFSPNDWCQRAQVVTFLWRAAGCPEPEADSSPFLDVTEKDFYYKAVVWAVEEGVTNGMDSTHFGPYVYCNRSQVVTFLFRLQKEPQVTGTENPFVDVPTDAWFAAPILWAVENGVTNGLSANTFGPSEICNRAHIVTFLHRALVDQAG